MSETDREAQYLQVFDAISAVASHCDGAVTRDDQGFNGQDTKFGRRVASVPFEAWTDDVKVEAARIILTYKQQVLDYTGIDVSMLDVVREARDLGTNYTARNDARRYERQVQNADKKALRRIDVVSAHGDPLLGISWDLKDPDFDAIKEAVRALPQRYWDGARRVWTVPVWAGVKDFIEEWDFVVTEIAWTLIDKPLPVHYDVTLQDNGKRVTIEQPYRAEMVDALRKLPGRAYAGGNLNHADVHPAVLALANQFGLKVHPDAVAACEKAAKALQSGAQADLDTSDREALMAHISRLRRPEDVPDVAEEILKGIL
jgi:hypothetical protein